MILIVISFVFGIVGFFLGGAIGGLLGAVGLGLMGMLSPALFILEQLYKNSVKGRESHYLSITLLDELRDNGIITDTEFEKARSIFSEKRGVITNREKYYSGVDILYDLSKEIGFAEGEYSKRISALKALYNQ